MSIPGVLDYTGGALVEVQSAEIPGVIELTIHKPTTVATALLDSYALSELRTLITSALMDNYALMALQDLDTEAPERTNDK